MEASDTAHRPPWPMRVAGTFRLRVCLEQTRRLQHGVMSAKLRVAAAHSNQIILFVGVQTEQRTLSRCFERSVTRCAIPAAIDSSQLLRTCVAPVFAKPRKRLVSTCLQGLALPVAF